MSGNGADRELWAKIRLTAGCEESAAEDAAVLEELEGAAQVRIAEQLGDYAGLGRGPGWVSQPGWILDTESEVDRIASFAIDTGDGEGILWEAFRELEQQRFKVFVNGCAREWMAQAEAQGDAQECLAGGSQAGDEQAGDEQAGDKQAGDEQDPSEWRCVAVGNLHPGVTAEQLQEMFEQVGIVLDATIGDEGLGQCWGCWGWAEFERREDAEEAVRGFDGVELAGREMQVRLTSG
jgi:hypothetical protein